LFRTIPATSREKYKLFQISYFTSPHSLFSFGAKACVHMYVNTKLIPVETIPGMGRGEMRAVEG
jgi:hypothetical protein